MTKMGGYGVSIVTLSESVGLYLQTRYPELRKTWEKIVQRGL